MRCCEYGPCSVMLCHLRWRFHAVLLSVDKLNVIVLSVVAQYKKT
jgi:hypothetical protein